MTRSRRDARGATTLWILGMCLMLFLLGGISLDLWRTFSERRALGSAADAAALAGASAVDENRYRETGEILLVPDEAEALARRSMSMQGDVVALRDVTVRATVESITVEARGSVGLTLLSLVHADELEIRVASTAVPRRSA